MAGILGIPTQERTASQAWCFSTSQLASSFPRPPPNPRWSTGIPARTAGEHSITKGGSVKNLTDNKGLGTEFLFAPRSETPFFYSMSLRSTEHEGTFCTSRRQQQESVQKPVGSRRKQTDQNNKTKALKIKMSLEPLTKVDQDPSAEPKHGDCQLK